VALGSVLQHLLNLFPFLRIFGGFLEPLFQGLPRLRVLQRFLELVRQLLLGFGVGVLELFKLVLEGRGEFFQLGLVSTALVLVADLLLGLVAGVAGLLAAGGLLRAVLAFFLRFRLGVFVGAVTARLPRHWFAGLT